MNDNYTNFLLDTLKEQITITKMILENLHEANAELEQRTRERDWWKEKADAYRSNSKEPQTDLTAIRTPCGD